MTEDRIIEILKKNNPIKNSFIDSLWMENAAKEIKDKDVVAKILKDEVDKDIKELTDYLVEQAKFELRETDGIPENLYRLLEKHTGKTIEELLKKT